jgi:hypothetical protein
MNRVILKGKSSVEKSSGASNTGTACVNEDMIAGLLAAVPCRSKPDIRAPEYQNDIMPLG